MWTTPDHFLTAEQGLPDSRPHGDRPGDAGLRLPEAVYLKPGELFFGHGNARVTTVLGSCVAVTMYDRRHRAAAMCHAVQPVCRLAASGCRTCGPERYQSVRCAVEEMIRRMDRMGASRSELEIKMFGGAALFGEPKGVGRAKSVGDQNIEAARNVLAEYGFRILAMEVGGGSGRKIIFHTTDGAVFLKRLKAED